MQKRKFLHHNICAVSTTLCTRTLYFESSMAISHTTKIHQKRVTTRRNRSRTNISTEQRKEASNRAKSCCNLLLNNVGEEHRRQDKAVESIAKAHSISCGVAKSLVQQMSAQKVQCAINSYNVWIHCKSIEVNEGASSMSL